jgi:hypothetical protein
MPFPPHYSKLGQPDLFPTANLDRPALKVKLSTLRPPSCSVWQASPGPEAQSIVPAVLCERIARQICRGRGREEALSFSDIHHPHHEYER